MPTLNWLGKAQVQNYSPPFHFLNKIYGNSDNKIIHGDNLIALKSLLPRYENKIKCIYIDPPYNTGNEGWIYNDNVNSPQLQKWLGQVVGKEGEDLTRHDKWLCMMYPRLRLLQRLLRDDGAIFISIDDNELFSLKFICDEIFGASNFVANFHWRRSESQNNTAKLISNVAEYVICYLKNKTANSAFNKINLTSKAAKEYRYKDEKGFFRRGTISDNSRGKNLIEITAPDGTTKTIKSIRTKEFIEEKDRQGLIYWTANGMPYLKIYLEDSTGQISNNWFDNVGVNEDAAEMLANLDIPFEYSKPCSFIERILQLATDKNSIVLDAFAGSGTTAHAVINLNKQDGGSRRFILVEIQDYAESITAERVRRVGGEFTFYEMGERLFDDDDFINDAVPFEKICEYIYFGETGKNFVPAAEKNLLGVDDDTAYYFFNDSLSWNTLALIKTRAKYYTIYAEACYLSDDELNKYKITFKQIPFDVRRY